MAAELGNSKDLPQRPAGVRHVFWSSLDWTECVLVSGLTLDELKKNKNFSGELLPLLSGWRAVANCPPLNMVKMPECWERCGIYQIVRGLGRVQCAQRAAPDPRKLFMLVEPSGFDVSL